MRMFGCYLFFVIFARIFIIYFCIFQDFVHEAYLRVQENTFNSERKMMSTVSTCVKPDDVCFEECVVVL